MSLASSENPQKQGTASGPADSFRPASTVPSLQPLPEAVKWVADDTESEVDELFLKGVGVGVLADVDEEDEGEGEVFSAMVSQSSSSSSAYFQRTRTDERENLKDLRAMRRAFSMGRIVPAAGRYRRIDHRSDPYSGDEALISQPWSSKKRASNFLETCRRLLGFSFQ